MPCHIHIIYQPFLFLLILIVFSKALDLLHDRRHTRLKQILFKIILFSELVIVINLDGYDNDQDYPCDYGIDYEEDED